MKKEGEKIEKKTKEKQQIRIKLKIVIVIVVIMIAIIIALIYFLFHRTKADESIGYSGEYNIQYRNLSEYYGSDLNLLKNEFKKKSVMNYEEYSNYCMKWKLLKKYTDSSQNYIVFSYYAYSRPYIEAKLVDVIYNKNDVDLYLGDKTYGYTEDISSYVIIIPTKKKINNVNVFALPVKGNSYYAEKPVIYLYPEEEKEVEVKLGNKENITCSYPNYINGWKVQAKTNGDLFDTTTKRNLYSLYYESKNIVNFKVEDTGFVVKDSDTAQFLEGKLKVLGLTEREAEEFIIYWLPKLQENNYNYIRFATLDEINNNMPLEINPNPSTLIRVLMVFKGLDNPINVTEQKLITPERNGFVAVEWGGTEIK